MGGFAEAKQRRVLEKKRPPVLVCTPGRLWELVSAMYHIDCRSGVHVYSCLLEHCEKSMKIIDSLIFVLVENC